MSVIVGSVVVVEIARKSFGGTRNLGELTRQELLLLHWPWNPPHPAKKSSVSGMLRKEDGDEVALSFSLRVHASIDHDAATNPQTSL